MTAPTAVCGARCRSGLLTTIEMRQHFTYRYSSIVVRVQECINIHHQVRSKSLVIPAVFSRNPCVSSNVSITPCVIAVRRPLTAECGARCRSGLLTTIEMRQHFTYRYSSIVVRVQECINIHHQVRSKSLVIPAVFSRNPCVSSNVSITPCVIAVRRPLTAECGARCRSGLLTTIEMR